MKGSPKNEKSPKFIIIIFCVTMPSVYIIKKGVCAKEPGDILKNIQKIRKRVGVSCLKLCHILEI